MPDALLAYEATCAAMEEELLRAGSVMAEAVRQWSRVSEPCGAVAMPEVAEFAREALAHDHRVGRVARRFCDADASYGFDSWTAEEVRSEAEQLAAQARTAGLDGGPWLGGFIDRLVQGPIAAEGVLR